VPGNGTIAAYGSVSADGDDADDCHALVLALVPFLIGLQTFCHVVPDKVIQGAQNINEIFGALEFHSPAFTLYLTSEGKQFAHASRLVNL
jgi:hypothetical protein